MKKLFLLLLTIMVLFAGSAEAAKKVPGTPVPSDYGCRGVMLGEKFDSETVEKKIKKKLLFDNDRAIFGQRIKFYTFKDGYVFGVDTDNNIVDIAIKDHDYIGRDGLRYGATMAKIRRVLGEVDRQFIEGVTWLIFPREGKPEERLMLEQDVDTRTLYSWRITSLPLTEEEAAKREGHDDEWESNDLNAVNMRVTNRGFQPRFKIHYRN